MATDGGARSPCEIGIDEKTAVLLDGDGSAQVIGKGAAYFLHATVAPEQCAKGAPVTCRNVLAYRLRQGEGKWNFKNWTGTGGAAYALSAENGVLKSAQSGGAIY